jgi:hypothetical protein
MALRFFYLKAASIPIPILYKNTDYIFGVNTNEMVARILILELFPIALFLIN